MPYIGDDRALHAALLREALRLPEVITVLVACGEAPLSPGHLVATCLT